MTREKKAGIQPHQMLSGLNSTRQYQTYSFSYFNRHPGTRYECNPVGCVSCFSTDGVPTERPERSESPRGLITQTGNDRRQKMGTDKRRTDHPTRSSSLPRPCRGAFDSYKKKQTTRKGGSCRLPFALSASCGK